MRWVFEICLFEPNGELQISEARFKIQGKNVIISSN